MISRWDDGSQAYTYDATGQQATASGNSLSQFYDGDGLRAKKTENSVTTYYLPLQFSVGR